MRNFLKILTKNLSYAIMYYIEIRYTTLQKGVIYMGDSKELKPKSFRINDETAEKFKEISASIGGNQQEALAKLIEAYEFQQGKAILTEKKSDIEQFEKYVACLTRMFMGSLEDNQNITETVRTEFEAQLKSKDEVIQDLQGQLKKAKEQKEEATRKAKASEEEMERLNQYNIEQEKTFHAKLDGLNDTLKEKDDIIKESKSLNSVLTASLNRLEEQVEQMKEDCTKKEELETELENLQKKHNKLTIEFDTLKANLSDFQLKHEESINEIKKHENEQIERVKEQCKIEQEKALLELEKKYQKEILELKEQKQTEIDKYQSKHYELLEQMEQKKKSNSKRKKEEN